jgi:DNA-binding transcriptional MocR family regulator
MNAVAPDPMPDAADLQVNFSVLPEQIDEMMSCFALLHRHDALAHAVRPIPVAATKGARERAARLLKSGGWTPDQDNILFAGDGRQALAASMAGLASAGDRLGVEAMTYPLVKGIATRLGISLVPIAMDDDGLRPDALMQAHRATPLKGVYLKPTMQNPLGITMSPGRRADIVAALQVCEIYAIEDGVYSYLTDEQPLAALDPSRTILISSVARIIALGLIVSPPRLIRTIASALRSGAWGASGLGLAIGLHFMRDDTVARISKARRRDAAKRQALAREVLDGMSVRGDPRSYHLWLELPDSWRADAFVASAVRARIAITAASAFAVGGGHAPNAVRIALASPPLDVLAQALRALRRLAEAGSDEVAMEPA